MHDIDSKSTENQRNHHFYCIEKIPLSRKGPQEKTLQGCQRIICHCKNNRRRDDKGDQNRGGYSNDAVPVNLFLYVHLLRLL